jgi:hypothetical protein
MDLSLGSLPGMARTSPSGRRQRGHIRKRGGSFQVLVYAGLDPLTGKDHYLSESTRNEAEAQKDPHAAVVDVPEVSPVIASLRSTRDVHL